MSVLNKHFETPITAENLKTFKTKDSIIQDYINYATHFFNQGYPYKLFMSEYNDYLKEVNVCLNLRYDNRVLVGDSKYNIKDRVYGSPYFNKVTDSAYHGHGTEVMSVLASSALRVPKLAKSNAPHIKLMPLIMSGYGDFLDKDFYWSVKYAVDNGANIIVMSQSKEFSIQPKILKKALSYAKTKGVLVVISAGNDAENIDHSIIFPHAVSKMYKKDYPNLIYVGASTPINNEGLIDEDSNYGKATVDIFAPGLDIPTMILNNAYTISSGTSFSAPIVASIAALVWSYHPKLSAKKLKTILMNSGTLYHTLVKRPKTDEAEQLPTIKFSDLSRSGRIINAYNALIMAGRLSR